MNININTNRNIYPIHEYDILITSHSPFASPYKIGKLDRMEVDKLYTEWFITKVSEQDEDILEELHKLYKLYIKHNKLTLFCWTQPKRCIASLLKQALINIETNFLF
jgi:hypothetical protein